MQKHIDRYQIQRVIGRGATSTVYFAYDPRVGREVAIKLMLDPAITNLATHQRFEHEVRAIATLEHPTIVPLYDFGSHEGQPYLVMRYMAGGSLNNQLRTGPIPLADVLVIISRVASALDQAHQKRIIHCDIKPDNILFDQYGNGFLSDFGIVKLPTNRTPAASGTDVTGTPAHES
jgi:serine/threonine-protein kinase